MTEDNERLVLNVDLNYGKLAQEIRSAMHFLQKLSDDLDRAAVDKKFIEKERRNGDRRIGE